MEEQWVIPEEFPDYRVSNLCRVERIWRTKTTPVKVVTSGSYVYCSLAYAPYKSKQVNLRVLLDKYFTEHCLQDAEVNDLPGEIWKNVVGWEESYEVSNLGRIRTKERYKKGKNGSEYLITPKIKKAYLDDDGYERISLYYDYNTKLLGVHRVVAEAFLPNPKNLPQVNHKNGIKHDNRVNNLEWIDNLANIRHSIETGLRDPEKFAYSVKCLNTNRVYASIAELCREIGDSYFSYNRILHYLHEAYPVAATIKTQQYILLSEDNIK